MRERFSNRLLLLITLSFCTLLQAADKPDRVFTFGVVPQQSSSVLAKKWGPLIQRIGQQSGIDLVYRTAPNIPAFEQNLAAGKYDLAYMNPYHYTVFSKSPGYRAMAKAKDRKIHGILVSHKDSGISSIEELGGKTLAFPSPAAFAASIAKNTLHSLAQIAGALIDHIQAVAIRYGAQLRASRGRFDRECHVRALRRRRSAKRLGHPSRGIFDKRLVTGCRLRRARCGHTGTAGNNAHFIRRQSLTIGSIEIAFPGLSGRD